MKGGGAEGDRGWDDLSALTDVEHMCGQHTNLAFFGGWAVGRGVYWPPKRLILIAIALENFAARPCPSLCEIRKAASISSFEHVSEKKAHRARGLGSDPGLDLAIPHSSNSFECKGLMRNQFLRKTQKIRLIAMSL
jgi:hypothetical protein